MKQITSVQFIEMFSEIAATMEENRVMLSRMDSDGGDGDHGTAMDQGFTGLEKTLATLDPRTTHPYRVFDIAAETFLNVDSAAAKLYASAFRRAGSALMRKFPVTDKDFSAAFLAMAEAIQSHGHAGADRKNMVDTWSPAAVAFARTEADGGTLTDCLNDALAAAQTVTQTAGNADAGAMSAVLMLRSIRDSLQGKR